MANKKITDLSSATTPLSGSELFETVQSGSSVKVAASDIANSATSVAYNSLTGRAYISAISSLDQTGSTSAGTAVIISTTVISTGISMATNGTALTRITFAAAGTYAIMPSLQLANSDTSNHNATVWFRKNGTNISNSSTVVTVPKLADGGNTFFQIVFYEQVTAGQYIEIYWQPTNTSVTLDAIAATATAPAAPSVILTAERIA
jgi:hypothetical protein